MKKVLSLLLVLALAMGMSTVAFAYKLDKNEDNSVGFSTMKTKNNTSYESEIDLDTVDPATSHFFFPVYNAATSANTRNNSFNFKEALSANEQAKSQACFTEGVYLFKSLKDVKLRTRVQKGSAAVRDVQFVAEDFGNADDAAAIRVRVVEHLKNTSSDGVEFEIVVYPTVDGDTWDYKTKGMTITGKVVNEFVEIDSDTAYVDLYNHIVADAVEAVKDIDYDLGPNEDDHTVIVHGRAANGAKYWGYSTTTPTTAQDAKMAEHDIDVVYNLDYIGLDRVAKHVTLDVDADTYIYDADFNLLGRGKDDLPLSKVYYVSYKEIVVAADVEPEPEPAEPAIDLPAPPADTGAFGAPMGPFENPSTGC